MRILLGFWRLLVGALWLAGVAALTLRGGEVDAEWLAEMPRLCAICGSRGTADAILNVVLFLPLGLVLGGRRRAAVTALMIGAAIAVGIELAQTALPGRHPSLADVALNATGAALGTFVHSLVAGRISGGVQVGGRLWGGVVGASFVIGGILMTPWPTDDDYWGQWMPDLGSMPQYRGSVLQAELNGRPLPSRRIPEEDPHRELLADDWKLSGHIVTGPDPAGVSPILSIYDGHQREVLLVGAHRDALVFRERTLGGALRFDSPDVRVPGAFAPFDPGDSTTIGASRSAGTTCLRLGTTEECGVGITPGRTWGLLLYVEGPREGFREIVDLLWLCGLFLPIGFFARRAGDLVAGVLLGLGGLVLAVAVTPLVVGPWYELAACLVGAGSGWGGCRVLAAVSRWSGTQPEGPPSSTIASSV